MQEAINKIKFCRGNLINIKEKGPFSKLATLLLRIPLIIP